MPKAKFICETCKEEKTVIFPIGHKPEIAVCEKCKREMVRKISTGSSDVQSAEMCQIGQTMYYHTTNADISKLNDKE